MSRRLILLLSILGLTMALAPAGALPEALGETDRVQDLLEDVEAPVARDLLPGDELPVDRNPDEPLRDPAAPPSALLAEPMADAASTEGCDYDAYPEDPDDASIKLGLVPYHELAPRLCEIEQTSDRVSVEVIGRSTQGRDLYLVTVTMPETAEEAELQDELHRLVTSDADAAIERFDELAEHYKVPIFVNNNIHGNEWEGTDASLEVIEDLAETDDPDELALLADTRLYFNMTTNPDGRVAGTRANGAGFDMNRDFITQTQPETRAVADVITTTSPLVMLDLHGYTIQTLIEPCTKPHNDNYEYDLYIKWALPQAEAMEGEILARAAQAPLAAAEGVEIPYRDTDEGWDDWPPIFTPMYAMHHGAIGHTIEVPHPVNRLYSSPAPVLQTLSRENTVVGRASIEATFAFAHDNHDEMLRDQLEIFRRGTAGEDSPGNDDGGNAVWNAQSFPDAYVIPGGSGQHSPTAAGRLVDMLATNGVQVQRATAAFTAGGTSYPAGSYIVDMEQPKRGLANTMLEAGRDISDDVSSMYDISGWSLGLLWGATVDAVDGPVNATAEPAPSAAPTGGVEDGDAVAYGFLLDDLAGMRALNELQRAGIDTQRGDDGTIIVAQAARPTLEAVADRTGVRFTAMSSLPARREQLHRLRLAVAATDQELHALAEMELDVVPVSTSTLNNGFNLDGYDVLVVASGLSYSGLNDDAQAEVDAFLARGGGVVGRGSTGASFNDDAGLLDVDRQSGPRGANGVVAVANDPASPIAGSSPDEGHSFVYGPMWFTRLGEGVRADQRLDGEDPLVAGHWSGSGDQSQDAAAGHATAVSGTDESSARVALFGTEPLFRAHPKGVYLQVAEALLWTANMPEATEVPAGGAGGDDDSETPDPGDGAEVGGVSRLFGKTRFETAAAISAATFDPGVGVAYIATGLEFADALAGGPAAITGAGPVLLVLPDAVPEVTADELARLQPQRVVVLGGQGAVSEAVLEELRRTTGTPVERVWGKTRFETAVEVSRTTFDPGSPVYVATGIRFPDALAGGVAAGLADGPVLLVLPDAIPAAVADELDRLDPPSITILGGGSAISPEVEESLRRHAPVVTRQKGTTRFGTAAAVSAAAFPQGSDVAYVATGAKFPDALAAVPAAGLAPGPVLLVAPDRLPGDTARELERLDVASILVLGGSGAVHDAVLPQLEGYIRDS